MSHRKTSKHFRMIAAGLLLGLSGILVVTGAVRADAGLSSRVQSTAVPGARVTATDPVGARECIACHPDKKNLWMGSPHAQAFENPRFQEGWKSTHQSKECLLCHTTNYQESTGTYEYAGVSCEACHGAPNPEHPAAEYPVRSDKDSCGTCHAVTLGEAQLSGHTGTAEIGCMDCHDPHSQGALFENPDDMCKDCHKEDLAAMDKIQAELHLRENVTCAGCHTLDVPHTFLYNFNQENMSVFMTGLDCASGISTHLASHAQSESTVQTMLQTKMNWPVVHRVSRARAALQCTDCHEMNEQLRADFKALGYSENDLDKIAWQSQDPPPITDRDLKLLVSSPRPGSSWILWLVGLALVFAIFEVSVARKLGKKHQTIEDKSDGVKNS